MMPKAFVQLRRRTSSSEPRPNLPQQLLPVSLPATAVLRQAFLQVCWPSEPWQCFWGNHVRIAQVSVIQRRAPLRVSRHGGDQRRAMPSSSSSHVTDLGVLSQLALEVAYTFWL